jgi:hypothetical protein
VGKVTDYLLEIIRKHLQDRRIVVWYDPEHAYADLVHDLAFSDVAILRYENSFFRLREQLEPFLEFVDERGQLVFDGEGRQVLIYVPMARSATAHALVEAECVGTFLEPGANPWLRNTRLAVIAQRFFKDADPARAAEISRQVEQNALSLRDLDAIAEHGQISTGALELIFKVRSTEEIALLFASSDSRDQEIAGRKALPDLAALLEADLGLKVSADTVGGARTTLRHRLLLTDLVASLPSGIVPEQISLTELPSRPAHREAARRICVNWRNRHDLRTSYAEAAKVVEQGVLSSRLVLPPESLTNVETFSFVEDTLLKDAQKRLLAGAAAAVADLATYRKQLFWSTFDGAYQIRWLLLETAAGLRSVAGRVRDELRSTKTASAMLEAYTRPENPWSLLDTLHRHLERQYTRFDPELRDDHLVFEQVVHEARRTYVDAVASCTEAFVTALEDSGFDVTRFQRQRELFSRYVATSGGKRAYVLVDALRFEMAREMVGDLDEHLEATLVPALAQLPTITTVGMAALLPRAQHGMELVEAGRGVAVRIDGIVLANRAARIKILGEAFGGVVTDLKLNDLGKPSKNLKGAIQKAGLIVVTSQEIDRWGEDAEDEDETRRYMDEVLDKLRRGIRQLAQLGATEIVVAADHGYLFAESLGDDRLLDPPNGTEVDRHRRVWIGRGGHTPPNCIRVSSARVGLGGDLELVWPRGYAGFRATGSRVYFHGGPSLQEIVIPVVVIRVHPLRPETPGSVAITGAPRLVTTRFCTVTLVYTLGLIASEEHRVKVVARAAGKEVGQAVAAKYGYDEDAGEITLRHNEENTATLMLQVGPGTKSVSIHVLDAAERVELDRKGDIPVRITL